VGGHYHFSSRLKSVMHGQCDAGLLSYLPCSTLCLKKNDTDVAHYNFNAHQQILLIFGTDIADRVCYQMVICYPTSLN